MKKMPRRGVIVSNISFQEFSHIYTVREVVDAVGNPDVLEQAISLASVAGRVVCLGFTETYAKISMLNVTKKELSIVGLRLQTYQFKKCVDVFNSGKTNIAKLITHQFDYTQRQEAFDLIENNQNEIDKIILKFIRQDQ